jgi:uncharacterized membrane protein
VVSDPSVRESTGARSGKIGGWDAPLLLVLCCAAYYTVWLTRICFERHDQFRSGATDLGIYHQLLWVISHGEPAYSTIIQCHLFGNHFCPILYLLAPITRLSSSAHVLLVAQTTALGAAAVILFLLARRKWESPWGAVALSASFMIYAPAHWLALDDFHTGVLAIPLLLLAALSLECRKLWLYWVCMLLALACKESVALVFLFWSVEQGARGRWKTALPTFLLAICTWYAATQIVIPWFRGSPALHLLYFRPYGETAFQIVTYLARHPGILISRCLESQSLLYIGQLLTPLAFLPALSPLTLLPALPTLLLNLLSVWPPTRLITYHYTAFIIPFLWLAIVNALSADAEGRGRLTAPKLFGRCSLAGVGVSLLLLANGLGFVKGFTEGWHSAYLRPADAARTQAIPRAIELIPPSASVSASFRLLPHVSARKNVYWFPVPFRDFDWSRKDELWPLRKLTPTQFARRVEQRPIDYVLLDTRGNFSPHIERRDFEADLRVLLDSERYEKLVDRHGILLLKRRHEGG